MAESEGTPARDLVAENFGFLIAYLLPGLLGLWAGFYASKGVQAWIKEGATHETTLGGFLLLLLASAFCGMTLQALAWAFFEEALPRIKWARRLWPHLERPEYDEARSSVPSIQARLAEYRDQHYRYYQHHRAVFVGLPAVLASWLTFARPTWGHVALGVSAFLIVWPIEYFAALDAIRRHRKKAGQLIGKRAAA